MPNEPKKILPLEQILTDILGEITVLESHDASFSTARVKELVAEIKASASEYLTFISEPAAMIRSNHKQPWFLQRFPEWQRQGHARFNPQRPRERQYRQLIVPIAHDVESVRSSARDAARGRGAMSA